MGSQSGGAGWIDISLEEFSWEAQQRNEALAGVVPLYMIQICICKLIYNQDDKGETKVKNVYWFCDAWRWTFIFTVFGNKRQ